MVETDPRIFNNRYVVRQGVAIEDFDAESLIFLPEERRLVKINAVARDILQLLDGERTAGDIVLELAAIYAVSVALLKNDVCFIIVDLSAHAVIKENRRLAKITDFWNMDNKKYSINREVTCRIEDPEGAILFHPETDAVQVINATGLAIWEALEFPRTKQAVVEHLLDVCEDVPEDQVVQDVEAFLEKLQDSGFIGEVLE